MSTYQTGDRVRIFGDLTFGTVRGVTEDTVVVYRDTPTLSLGEERRLVEYYPAAIELAERATKTVRRSDVVLTEQQATNLLGLLREAKHAKTRKYAGYAIDAARGVLYRVGAFEK